MRDVRAAEDAQFRTEIEKSVRALGCLLVPAGSRKMFAGLPNGAHVARADAQAEVTGGHQHRIAILARESEIALRNFMADGQFSPHDVKRTRPGQHTEVPIAIAHNLTEQAPPCV